LWAIYPNWPWTVILLISVSQVVRIPGVSYHQHPASGALCTFKKLYVGEPYRFAHICLAGYFYLFN
jgi:hypothetical protein